MITDLITNLFKSKADQIEKALDLVTLPLNSQFKFLQFSGLADGTNLVQNFPPDLLPGRVIVIKAIKVLPYYSADSIDFSITDGVTTNSETVRVDSRVNRVFDEAYKSNRFFLDINGRAVDLFPVFTPGAILPPVELGNIPMDLDVDNIFYKFPEKITSLQIRLNGRISSNVTTGADQTPFVKVWMQCYLI